jgi:hypothetical protein
VESTDGDFHFQQPTKFKRDKAGEDFQGFDDIGILAVDRSPAGRLRPWIDQQADLTAD